MNWKRLRFPLAVFVVVFGTFYSIVENWSSFSIFFALGKQVVTGKEVFYQKYLGKTITVSPPAKIIETKLPGFFGTNINTLMIGSYNAETVVSEIIKPTDFMVFTAYEYIPDFSFAVTEYCILTDTQMRSTQFTMECNELDKILAKK